MSASKGVKAYNQLSDWLNGATDKEKREFINSINTEHRELQTQLCNLMVGCMYEWEKMGQTGRVDERNVYAVNVGTAVARTLR